MVDWPLYGDREADVFSGSPGQSESGDCGLCLAVIGGGWSFAMGRNMAT